MSTAFTLNTRTFASSANFFWAVKDYAVQIDVNGVIRFKRGDDPWVDFNPQPIGQPTHIAADNNRIFVRTDDGKLH